MGGYVIGALDTHDFEARLERDWWPKLRAEYPEPPASVPEDRWTPEQAKAHLIHHPWVTPGELASRYPSELHINLVPRLQSGPENTAAACHQNIPTSGLIAYHVRLPWLLSFYLLYNY